MKRISFFIFLAFFVMTTFAQGKNHVVQKGETLYSIARKHGISVEEICRANGITDPTKIEANQLLLIPEKSESAADSNAFTASRSEIARQIEYKVERGDTLFGIAKKFSADVDAVLSANGMEKNDILKVGQTLKIPQKEKKEAKPKPTAAKPSPAPTIKLTDPRSINEKKMDPNIIWPINATSVSYIEGKTNSVLLTAKQKGEVKAIKGGLVIFAGLYRGFGQVVFVHSQKTGHIYVYGGLETISVKKGQNVTFNDKIGSIGVDSITGKPSLNLMVFQNGEPVDPAKAPRG